MMMLKGKVAVITGSGRGIGRGMALLFAKEGAKVVVNDLGGEVDGTGKSVSVADMVVKEIKDAGGEAVANYDTVTTVETGQKIIDTAVKTFGKLDILVNNAGILRDRMFFNMTEAEWDAVIAVHLKGHFCVTRPAAVIMRQQKSGRIINFSSTSGLLGNAGQANYGAAKAGIAGFTRVLALEMSKYNVTVNAIAPGAWTRMINTIPGAAEPKGMKPECIAPMVVYLASDEAQHINGQVFGVRGNMITVMSHPRDIAAMYTSEEIWTPQEIAEKFPQTLERWLVTPRTQETTFRQPRSS
ncbi:MAG: SDR family oxidoreductase [Candidatus Tectomicrobia bacterium]|uniref:SDR family oxidoreductase n=1 Tax=Tectimicrobiota bacterium TaxID=2528274 RepID=A0A933LQL3_UNCTE|nr:SDR family oxidoreductase [Candidatus Tectomicrobia bacterium]